MTQADLERRIRELEQKVVDLRNDIRELEHGQIILSTGVALARWIVPVCVSVAAIIVIFVK